ncbi:hypothetical protein L873DRAFT_1721288 [Choiromyces venosus 120613-1]|uniref:Uncharacterized protein n=1 Tax=Choiromyces venosus 120613-1 TaxID=1336337 RepID=A0A3N4IZB5_9PEZI|nr:hypothetical protein L873DRAFT_1721288 [Choiromyces venosus 120613-1]
MATNADEGYEAIGPAKVVQYAPMVQDKASKALAGHEKVNFGDIDSKKAAPAPGQAVHRNSASNSPTGFGDLRISLNSFASQPAEVRLLPRTAQSPPGLLLPGISLPPGLPIPARYYQKQGINPPTGSANISFCQPGERSTPFTQAIDHPQAGPDYYRQLCPDIGSFTVGQRSDANNSYLGLDVTDAEIKAINDAFSKYGQINKREALSLTDRYGRRGAVSEQGSTSRAKDDKPAINLGNPETVEKDNFKERFAEVFGTKGKVSIEMLQEHQKKRLVAERVRNDKLAKEAQKDPEPVPGNTGLFPYPAHGRSDDEVAQELLLMAFEQLSSYVGDGTISGEKDRPTLDRPGPWKASVEKFAEWITKDNSSFFDQYFGKDYIPKGEETASESSSKQLVVDAGRTKQTTANHGASNTGDSENEPAGEDLATKDEKSIDQGQASSISDPVIFGPPKPQGYPNHPPREHPRALKAFAPFENDYPTVRYGLLPANPRSVNTVEKSYINYRGGAVGPVADSAPRYVIGPKGYLELATDIPPPAPVDLFPFRQHKANPSPFAALEEALGTTRFTQSVPQPSHQASPKPPPGAKPTGGIISDAINGFSRVNYGGRQTQLNPDGSGLPRSEISKRKQCPGARLGINFDGSNGMEFDIDDTAFKPADHNVLGGKFKIKSQLRKEQEALRAQLPQQPQQPQVGTSHPTTPAKGISVQGKGSVTGSGTRSVFNKPPGGNLRQGFGAPGNWAVQGNPEPKRGAKGWNSGVGGRQ